MCPDRDFKAPSGPVPSAFSILHSLLLLGGWELAHRPVDAGVLEALVQIVLGRGLAETQALELAEVEQAQIPVRAPGAPRPRPGVCDDQGIS
ncbi:hypothetical protein THAOC_25705, partial [Thalassiosira oceanica]